MTDKQPPNLRSVIVQEGYVYQNIARRHIVVSPHLVIRMDLL